MHSTPKTSQFSSYPSTISLFSSIISWCALGNNSIVCWCALCSSSILNWCAFSSTSIISWCTLNSSIISRCTLNSSIISCFTFNCIVGNSYLVCTNNCINLLLLYLSTWNRAIHLILSTQVTQIYGWLPRWFLPFAFYFLALRKFALFNVESELLRLTLGDFSLRGGQISVIHSQCVLGGSWHLIFSFLAFFQLFL